MDTTIEEATGTRTVVVLAGAQTGRMNECSSRAMVSTPRRTLVRKTSPGMAIKTGRHPMMATESMIAADVSTTPLKARTGQSTGSIPTKARGRTGGRTEEAAASTTMTIGREATTTTTSEEPGKIGKEIKRIMTSQISPQGKEVEALEGCPSKRSESKTMRLRAGDAAVVREARTRRLAGIKSQKALAPIGQ